MHLTEIRRYPVKSCRGESLDEVAVEPWGIAGDRRWMVVDETGRVVTARECHAMLRLVPQITAVGLRLSGPDLPALDVRRPDGGELVEVGIWSSDLDAAPAGPEADAWFTEATGRPARLVYLDDPTRRVADQEFAQPDDRVSFADGYPVLLCTEASLAALNDAMLERHQGDVEPLPMVRFRPSVVIGDAAAWAEDDWRRLRIGDLELRLVKPCARCVMTTVDPETLATSHEPIATLARIRRWDGATWFGINCVPARAGATIRVGDEVEVLE